MSLIRCSGGDVCSCDCDFDWDGNGWYWNGKQLIIMPPVSPRKRCGCCNKLINWGEEVFRFHRFRSPNSDIEERIYGDETPIPPWYTCEECSDLISAVEDLGFCWDWGDSIVDQIAAYLLAEHEERAALLAEHNFNLKPDSLHQRTIDVLRELIDPWVSQEDIARFWVKVEQTDYCWLWKGSVNKDGYGKYRMPKTQYLAHRFAYAVVSGITISELNVVAHKCDNPQCVNPSHLFETDHQGNMSDRHIKGRTNKRCQGASSRFMGVSWRNDSKNWRATMGKRGSLKSLGSFDFEEDAAKAYDDAMYSRYGATLSPEALNFPERFSLPSPPTNPTGDSDD